jgi:hypothetical protein
LFIISFKFQYIFQKGPPTGCSRYVVPFDVGINQSVVCKHSYLLFAELWSLLYKVAGCDHFKPSSNRLITQCCGTYNKPVTFFSRNRIKCREEHMNPYFFNSCLSLYKSTPQTIKHRIKSNRAFICAFIVIPIHFY